MNGNIHNLSSDTLAENDNNAQQQIPTQSLIGMVALTRSHDIVPDALSERVELARTLIDEIRRICEDDLVFDELMLRGIDDREDDNKSHIELVWSGNPFPLYEQHRTVSYVDEKGIETPLLITIVGMGSYAVKADAWPPTNGVTKKRR
jgi:hypothetical protein